MIYILYIPTGQPLNFKIAYSASTFYDLEVRWRNFGSIGQTRFPKLEDYIADRVRYLTNINIKSSISREFIKRNNIGSLPILIEEIEIIRS